MNEEFGVWGASAPAASALPQLTADHECDVALIGAGYTGLSTALHLAEAGRPCTVIEAHEPGWGASGRNTGWLEPNWWLKKPSDIGNLFGAERGTELTRWVSSGPRLLDDWIARYALRTEIERRGLVLATDQPEKAAALEAEAREWNAAGIDHAYLDAAAVRRHIPSDRYKGALFLHNGATLNPLALSRELARACLERGVKLFGNTPAHAIAREGALWRVSTRGGTVRARRLVLATDAYTRDLWPALGESFASWHVAVIASEPYAGLDEILPQGSAFADLDLGNVFTLRKAHGGRLVTSTFAPVRRSLAAPAVAEPFMRKFRKVFPGRLPPRWQYVHFGEIGLSRDMLPRLAQIGPSAWTAYGYSGTGINLALLLGGELARLTETDDARASRFPVTRLEPLAMRRLIGWGLRYVHAPLARGLISRMA